jgi:hypothetical protein
MTEQMLHLESICDPKATISHLTDYLGHLRADVEPVDENTLPLDTLDGPPDEAVTGSGSGPFGIRAWTVQAFLRERNDGTLITLRALGEETSSLALSRRRSTMSLASSVKKMERLARLLRAMDAGARMQRLHHA